jgi:hypothetical protein
MRYFGNRQIPVAPVIPDVVLSLQLTANSAQAFDYPTGTDLIRVSVGSSVAGQGVAYFNPASTGAVLPTTPMTPTTNTSGHNIPIRAGGPMMWQRPRASTGFSLIAPTSVQACVEFWSRGAA